MRSKIDLLTYITIFGYKNQGLCAGWYNYTMSTYRVVILLSLSIALLAAGCTKHPLPREVPTSPTASYNQLPQ